MKYFITTLFFLSLSALADEECSSVWVYKPYKTCANAANGLDTSAAPTSSVTINLYSDWLKGGTDKQKVCPDMLADFNGRNMATHSQATLTKPFPIDPLEIPEDRGVVMGYRYACQFEVKNYPFKSAPNPACGTEEKYSYKVGGSAKDLPGAAQCLSCDNLKSKPPEETVQCLSDNISNVIKPKAIDLRDSDIQAVTEQVGKMLSLSARIPIKNLQSTEQLSQFNDFLRENQNGRSSGGSLPILK